MKKISAVILFMLFCAGFSYAQHYIYLKNGQEIKGKIVSETDSTVTVLVEGKNEKKVFKFNDILDITKTRKSDVDIIKQAESAEAARIQFTSLNKSELDGSDIYVQDNRSGVIVYNIKDSVTGKDFHGTDGKDEFDAAAYLLSGGQGNTDVKPAVDNKPKAEKKPKIKPAKNDEFDAAAYLLSGGQGNTDVKPAVDNKPKAEKKPKIEPAKTVQNDDDFDAAAYLLEPGSDSASSTQSENKKEETIKEDDYDSTKYLLGGVSAVKSDSKKAADKRDTGESQKPSAETVLAVGFDLKGSHIVSGTSKDSDYGISFLLERYGYFCNFAAAGVGIGYEHQRGLDKISGRVGFIPLYAALKARIADLDSFNFYAVVHLGYNFMVANSSYLGQADSKGGLYYAGGAGAVYERFVFQILYSVNNGGLTYSNSSPNIDVTFSKVGFYIGYMF
ncbi:MAG: hypothetical protein FWD54_00315 [Endomicrobia bacterium]|nr:hypothetical protein [Endomicrobiia bacterium]MCL2798718.1 hypothetical protein [Endomicrobiia bacterium]